MKNKFISITLVFAMIFCSALMFSGCGDKNYPVKVANLTIKEEPENIVVLDPSAADIISFIGYHVKMVGRSDEVNQEDLSVAPSVGSAAAPDVNKIKDSGATIVFANSQLADETKQELEKNDIQVIKLSEAKTTKQLETNYITLGKILGGNDTGANKGSKAYDELLGDMEQIKTTVNSSNTTDVLYTVCYIYTENNELKMMTSGTYGDMLLGYTGAVNAAVNIDDDLLDTNTLRIANPNFIFYSDNTTLQSIKTETVLSQLTAVKQNKMLMVSSDEMSRQGQTALDTLQKMVGFMYPELAKETTQAATDATNVKTTTATTAATTVPSASASANNVQTTAPSAAAANAVVSSVADDYNIKLGKLSLKAEDDNDNVKAMQQRLYDLGYITDKENITGYYGEISQAAVKQFQKNNSIKQTGTADNATLTAMFNSNAVKAK